MARPRILILATNGSTYATGLSNVRAYREALPILQRLGYDVECYTPATLTASGIDDEARYDGCIIPRVDATTMANWGNGLKSYPVLCMNDDTTESASWRSGVASKTTGITDFTPSSTPGGFTVYNGVSFSAVTLVEHADITSLITISSGDYAGKSWCWVDERADYGGKSGSFVMRATSASTYLPQLLAFLNRANLVAPNPQIYFMELDDISGNYTENVWFDPDISQYVTGMGLLSAYAQARNTQVLGGLILTDRDLMPASLMAFLQDGDTFPTIIHDHDYTVLRSDAIYDTVAKKIAIWDQLIDAWNDAGVYPHRSGYGNHLNAPNNTTTAIARQMITQIGCRSLRVSDTSVRVLTGSPVRLVEDDDGTVRPLACRGTCTTMAYDSITWDDALAGFMAYGADSSEAAKLWYYQTLQSVYDVCYGRGHLMWHPYNFLSADGSTPAGILVMQALFDPWVDLGGPDVCRWATPDDWKALGDCYRRTNDG